MAEEYLDRLGPKNAAEITPHNSSHARDMCMRFTHARMRSERPPLSKDKRDRETDPTVMAGTLERARMSHLAPGDDMAVGAESLLLCMNKRHIDTRL